MNNEIGGYFSLELVPNSFIHSKGCLLNTGRNALEYILRSIPVVKKIWVPFFTCDAVLEPLNKLGVSYHFYFINEQLELAQDVVLASDEYLLVTNYFGIKDCYIEELVCQYGDKLIVDNAQALYSVPIAKTIYSPRKFVGIPDGGIAYIKNGLDIANYEKDLSYNRCSHLLKRLDLNASVGYDDFKDNDKMLANNPIRQMSNLTRSLVSSINFELIRKKRLKNFLFLDNKLSSINLLKIPPIDSFVCPMVYPFLSDDKNIKDILIREKIFVATYWPNVLNSCGIETLEYYFAKNIIPIPIDQRYDESDMCSIIKLIKENGK